MTAVAMRVNGKIVTADVEPRMLLVQLLSSDIHADADYRAHLISVMAGRAVQSALH